MNEVVEKWLGILIGLPLANAGRAADMMWFSFGKETKVTDSRGCQKNIGEYALHVQCAWRLVGPHGTIVGSGDIHYPAENIEEGSDFNWDLPGENLCDQRIKEFLQIQQPSLLIETVSGDFMGGFKIRFIGGFVLEVFPCNSSTVEEWRLFQPGANRPHCVLKGGLIQS